MVVNEVESDDQCQAKSEAMKLSAIIALVIVALSPGGVTASSIDFYPINFKSGMPSAHDDFKGSLNASWDTYSKLLKIDASLLISLYPKYRFKVVGFTDDQECRGEGCKELSLRRATYVQKWLLDNGVPADELDPPEGHGAEAPLESNDSPVGRQRNRRVEINFVLH